MNSVVYMNRSAAIQGSQLGSYAAVVLLAVVFSSLCFVTASHAANGPAASNSQSAAAADRKPGDAKIAAQVVTAKIGEPTIRHIGPVTTVTEVSTGLPFRARVDTGATSCSIHYEAIEIEDPAKNPEENVGKRVRILVKNSNGEPQWIHTKIVDNVIVRTSTTDDERYKVRLKFRWQDVEKKVTVTLSDREKMKYPVLLGRNFLRGDFLVDVDLDSGKQSTTVTPGSRTSDR